MLEALGGGTASASLATFAFEFLRRCGPRAPFSNAFIPRSPTSGRPGDVLSCTEVSLVALLPSLDHFEGESVDSASSWLRVPTVRLLRSLPGVSTSGSVAGAVAASSVPGDAIPVRHVDSCGILPW